ncbi:hypothetical protein BGZ97_001148, partial [Linnemannia gamsii]
MPALTVDTQCFLAASRLVKHIFHDRINHAAQTSLANDILCVAAGLRSAVLIEQLHPNTNDIDRIQSLFHHLDLLSIGSDHVFVIHRELLLQDIRDYLSGSEHGLRRVFINVDYLLPEPEILPGRRYEPLDKYLRKHLLPYLETRVQCWDQAELHYLPLPAPDCIGDDGDDTAMAPVESATTAAEPTTYSEIETQDATAGGLSMVTLSGWLLGYPVNYVIPTIARMMARKKVAKALKKRERIHYQQRQQQGDDQVLQTATVSHDSTDCSTCIDDGNMNDDGGGFGEHRQGGQSSHPAQDEEDDEDEEEEDSSHNSLANRQLILTQINLSANEDVHGLQDYCLLSFSYPASILDGHSLATTGAENPSPGDDQLPATPASPVWFPGSSCSSSKPVTGQETNLFETCISSNNPQQSYQATTPGALPTTLAPIVPSSCPIVTARKSSPTIAGPSAGVVPSVVFAPSSPMMQKAPLPPPLMQPKSRHPFDVTSDSSSSGGGDDPSSSSDTSHNHRHH